MSKHFLYILFLLCGFSLKAQLVSNGSDPKDLFEKLGYMAYVEKKSSLKKEDPEIFAKLGESYRLNGETETAAYWYRRAIDLQEKPEWLLVYSKLLQSNGDCENAVLIFEKFRRIKGLGPKSSAAFMLDCGAKRMNKEFANVNIQALKGLNTDYMEFSPIPVEGGIIFTSNRGPSSPIGHEDNWTKSNFTDLYFAKEIGKNQYSNPKMLSGSANSKFHNGTASIFNGGKEMFYTANVEKGVSKNQIHQLKIEKAIFKEGRWTFDSDFSLNEKNSSTFHPTLSENGKLMVFVSDRKGGLGQADLYVSKKENNAWSTPVNLGLEINSSGNELFPFLDDKGRLFFASDGRAGMGGLDLFVCEKLGPSTWGEPQNLGSAINSTKDDFGFYIYPDGKSGYFSSNREGGQGKDDIYFWEAAEAPIENCEEYISLKVIDASEDTPLGGAKVDWTQKTSDGAILGEGYWISDAEGMVKVPLDESKSYVFNAKKNGYKPERLEMPGADLKKKMVEIPLDATRTGKVNAVVMDRSTGDYKGGFGFELYNNCTGLSTTFATDDLGNFEMEGDCGCNYSLKSLNSDYSFLDKDWIFDCKKPLVQLLVEREESDAGVFNTGKVIILKNLYYDFDKWNIRSDAATELDRVVDIMKKYPSMEVELGSHTDSRGNDAYNLSLSQKRAESAVAYIVSRGIEKSRITAKGYGESQLVNECSNGIECEEYKHQKNRRTVIKVTKFDSNTTIIQGGERK
jgi:outer membrane protein OmpA-like peptidoglycan-associated protein/tetratricopeptide (TPR) repeat protein